MKSQFFIFFIYLVYWREKRIYAARVRRFDAPFLDMKSLKYFTFWRMCHCLLLKLRPK